MSLNALSPHPRQIVSPSVFYGFDPHNNRDYTFRDSTGKVHVLASFEDAKTILFVEYSHILKRMGVVIDASEIEKAIKKSPNGNSAYFSLILR